MSSWTFKVPGKPIPKGSARSFAIKRSGQYTGKTATFQTNAGKLALWEAKIQFSAQRAGVELLPAATVIATFFLKRPKAHVGARGLRPRAPLVPVVKPDLDKLIRALLDGLTGVAWVDDSQVVSITAQKEYAELDEEEGVTVALMEAQV